MLVFTPVESEAVQRSILMVLERNESHNHTLSLDSLPPAQYLVLVYELNREGSLSSGVSYPAVMCELNASHFTQGSLFTIIFRLMFCLGGQCTNLKFVSLIMQESYSYVCTNNYN